MLMLEPLILWAPGAGAPSSSAWMRRFGERLGAYGRVVALDYPYQAQGRKLPDRLPVLIAAHAEALDAARQDHRGPVVLAGKSMGSRVSCHVSLQRQVDAVICFGYPLRGGGRKATLRDEVLRAMTTPVLFVQGTRDPLCPLDLLVPLLRQLQAPSRLHVVESGDHSLQATRTWLTHQRLTQEQLEASVFEAVGQFIAEHAHTAPRSGAPK